MPSQWLAVDAGTDLRARARQIQRSWESLLAGGALNTELPLQATAELRPAIVDSWRRSLATGLDPTDLLPSIEADPAETRERWLEHPLGALRHVLAAHLQMLARESNSLVQVTDPSGLTLHLDGPAWLKARAAEMNLVEGARCAETVNGTNGVGTALAADHPVQVFAFEHFSHHHREWVCSGSPVHDPVSGRLVGILDLSSPWKIAHPRSLELVTKAARALEQRLLETRRDRDARLRRRYGDLATRSTDLLVNGEGYVLVGGDPAQAKPLEIPESGGEIAMADGSTAVAEPLGQGEAYLVRRRAPGRAGAAPAERARRRAHERAREHVGGREFPAAKQAERHLRELADEQAALRRVATLVAHESSPQQLFATVAEQVGRLLDVPLTRLVRYESGGSAAELIGGWGESVDPLAPGTRWQLDGPGVLASVWWSGRPARLDDYTDVPGQPAAVVRKAGMRSAVASPITVEGRLWGAIVVLSSRPEPLPESTEARLADFTELVATALANAESRAELAASEARARKLAEEQAALRRVATLVAERATAEDVHLSVAREVAHVFGVSLVTVCRYEPDAVVVLAALGAPQFPIGSSWPLDVPSLPRTIRETGRPARIDDYSTAVGLDAIARDGGVRASVGVPIVVDGSVWGSVNVATPEEKPFPADAEVRLARFTELVATAVSNATMRAEVAASRARVIAAGDESRRRIERDLHDGAQQQLVTLALELRSAERRVPDGLDELRKDVGRFADRLTTVIEELREISRGIHPAILTEGGLSPALEALALRSPVPVEFDVRCEGRMPDGIEAAAYYVASEALTNAAKHADASRVRLELHVDDGALALSIVDDGVGGADPRKGSGLIGLGDRVEALGGTIEVVSPPGSGTRLDVRIPLLGDPSVAADSRHLSRV